MLLRVDLQCPGERPARLLHSSHTDQPARRFRDPSADQQGDGGGQQTDREQAAPADNGGGERAQRGTHDARDRQQRGHQPTDKAALRGRHEFLDQRQVDGKQPGDAEADKKAADAEKDPAAMVRGQRHDPGGDREIERGGDKDVAPADAVGEPAVKQRARNPADARGQKDDRRLAVGQLPRTDDKGERKTDQPEVEIIEHVADHGSRDDLLLIARQPLLPLEQFQHASLRSSTQRATSSGEHHRQRTPTADRAF